MTVALEVRNLRKTFPGVVALADANITVEAGSIHALMGENGAGKSTLIKIVTGVQPADSGSLAARRRDCVVRATRSRRWRPASASCTRSATSSASSASARTSRCRGCRGASAAWTGRRSGARRSGASRCSTSTSIRGRRCATCRRRRRSSSRSRAACTARRRCCCSTSRPHRSASTRPSGSTRSCTS